VKSKILGAIFIVTSITISLGYFWSQYFTPEHISLFALKLTVGAGVVFVTMILFWIGWQMIKAPVSR